MALQALAAIPTEELLQDLADAFRDEANVLRAMASGITDVDGQNLEKIIDGNREVIEIIKDELSRRISPTPSGAVGAPGEGGRA